jgi:hypothetical protein
MGNSHNMWLHTVSYSIFHELNCLSEPATIFETINLIRDTFRRIEFDSISVKYLDRYKVAELKPLNRNWDNMRKKINEGRIETLVFGSKHPNGYSFNLGVSVSLYEEKYRQANVYPQPRYDHISIWMNRSALDDNIVSLQECSDLMQSIWKNVHGVYGYADYFISHLAGSRSMQDELAAEQEFGTRCWKFSHIYPSEFLREHVPDIFWLNFLNHNHIKLSLIVA